VRSTECSILTPRRSIESSPNLNIQSVFLALRVIIVEKILPAVIFAVIGPAARQLFH